MRAPFFMTERDESLLSDVASAKKQQSATPTEGFKSFVPPAAGGKDSASAASGILLRSGKICEAERFAERKDLRSERNPSDTLIMMAR